MSQPGKPKDPPVEQDAARRREQDAAEGVDLTGLSVEQAYKLGGFTVDFARQFTATWLRSPETLALLQRHFHANRTGCGCGAIYGEGEKSYAEHLQRILAEDVER